MRLHKEIGTAVDQADLWQKLLTFAVDTVGWTLHCDERALETNPYYVLFSAGENNDEDIYLRFVRDNAYYIKCSICIWFDEVNKVSRPAEVFRYYTSSRLYSGLYTNTGRSMRYIFWGNKNTLIVSSITEGNRHSYLWAGGLLDRYKSVKAQRSLNVLTAGDNVVVEVDDASIFEVGKTYTIMGKSGTTAGYDKAEVTARDTAGTPNTITLDNINKDFHAGVKIGDDPSPVFTGNCDLQNYIWFHNRIDGSTSYSDAYLRPEYYLTYLDPQAHDQRFGVCRRAAFITATTSNELRGFLSFIFDVDTDEEKYLSDGYKLVDEDGAEYYIVASWIGGDIKLYAIRESSNFEAFLKYLATFGSVAGYAPKYEHGVDTVPDAAGILDPAASLTTHGVVPFDSGFIELNGTDTYCDEVNGLPVGDALYVPFIFRVTANQSGTILAKGDLGTSDLSWYIEYIDTGHVEFHASEDGINLVNIGPFAAPHGKIYRGEMLWDGTELTAYIDGALIGSTPLAAMHASALPMLVGARENNGVIGDYCPVEIAFTGTLSTSPAAIRKLKARIGSGDTNEMMRDAFYWLLPR